MSATALPTAATTGGPAGAPGDPLTAALVGEMRESALLLGMLLVVLALAAGLGSALLLLG
jgi:hypothetical protein